MKRLEKKHSHIITNLTQKVKLLEKAVLSSANCNEEIKDILKPKKKKSEEKKESAERSRQKQELPAKPEKSPKSRQPTFFNRNRFDLQLHKQFEPNELQQYL